MSTTAIILAAGKGTRMNSDLPKVLHEVCGRPMVSHVLDVCRAVGCDRLITVIGHQADLVRERLGQNGDAENVVWVEQTEQLGTGHAVMVCEDQLQDLEGPVLVVAGDGPLLRAHTLADLIETHLAEGAACTLATSILPDPGRYGRILRDDDGNLTGIVEYLDATEDQRAIHEVNVSLYCFDAAALRSVLGRLTNDNSKGEYYLTEALELLGEDGGKLAAVAAVPPEDTISINTVDELEEVNRIMAARQGEGD